MMCGFHILRSSDRNISIYFFFFFFNVSLYVDDYGLQIQNLVKYRLHIFGRVEGVVFLGRGFLEEILRGPELW